MIPDPIVELSGVTIRYGNQSILAGLDLQIAKGSFIALVGPSGSGKTTLLKTINGLVSPNDGRVHINGRNIAETPPAELRRGIGYAFQGIGLFPHMTVAENIGIVPRLSGWSEQERGRSRFRTGRNGRLAQDGSAAIPRFAFRWAGPTDRFLRVRWPQGRRSC